MALLIRLVKAFVASVLVGMLFLSTTVSGIVFALKGPVDFSTRVPIPRVESDPQVHFKTNEVIVQQPGYDRRAAPRQ